LCINPCTNPDFPHYSKKSKVCYNTKALAEVGTGACNTWCTTNVKYGTGCGDTSVKLCDNPCKNPDFLYSKNNLCYSTKLIADGGGNECKSWCTNDVR